jgi:hypothetical protein
MNVHPRKNAKVRICMAQPLPQKINTEVKETSVFTSRLRGHAQAPKLKRSGSSSSRVFGILRTTSDKLLLQEEVEDTIPARYLVSSVKYRRPGRVSEH